MFRIHLLLRWSFNALTTLAIIGFLIQEAFAISLYGKEQIGSHSTRLQGQRYSQLQLPRRSPAAQRAPRFRASPRRPSPSSRSWGGTELDDAEYLLETWQPPRARPPADATAGFIGSHPGRSSRTLQEFGNSSDVSVFVQSLYSDANADKPWSECAPASNTPGDGFCETHRDRRCAVPSLCGTRVMRESRRCECPVRVDELRGAGVDCGEKQELSFRIVGGHTTVRGAWKWMAALVQKDTGQVFCGGTLISPQWVITAAHCFYFRNGTLRPFTVVLGEHDTFRYEGTELRVDPRTLYLPKTYVVGSLVQDIGLVRLSRSVSPSTHIGFACVPPRTLRFVPGRACTVVGWGRTSRAHDWGTNLLQEVELPVAHDLECMRSYRHDFNASRGMLCAGRARGKDTCLGDSGGGLVCPVQVGDSRRWVVYGVTSYGGECGFGFGVYQSVPAFSDWVLRVMSQYS